MSRQALASSFDGNVNFIAFQRVDLLGLEPDPGFSLIFRDSVEEFFPPRLTAVSPTNPTCSSSAGCTVTGETNQFGDGPDNIEIILSAAARGNHDISINPTPPCSTAGSRAVGVASEQFPVQAGFVSGTFNVLTGAVNTGTAAQNQAGGTIIVRAGGTEVEILVSTVGVVISGVVQDTSEGPTDIFEVFTDPNQNLTFPFSEFIGEGTFDVQIIIDSRVQTFLDDGPVQEPSVESASSVGFVSFSAFCN